LVCFAVEKGRISFLDCFVPYKFNYDKTTIQYVELLTSCLQVTCVQPKLGEAMSRDTASFKE
ncbi:MAG: hypothetical protein D6772_00830, partial [Bacteroidetes bacterium]